MKVFFINANWQYFSLVNVALSIHIYIFHLIDKHFLRELFRLYVYHMHLNYMADCQTVFRIAALDRHALLLLNVGSTNVNYISIHHNNVVDRSIYYYVYLCCSKFTVLYLFNLLFVFTGLTPALSL